MKTKLILIPTLALMLGACNTQTSAPTTVAPAPKAPAAATPVAPASAPTSAPAAVAPAVVSTSAPAAAAPADVPTAAATLILPPPPTAGPAQAQPATAAPPPTAPTGCVKDFDPAKDYFPVKAEFRYASNLVVDYFNNYKIVTVSDAWRGSKEKFTYVLVQCGTPIPSNVPANAQVIEIPAKRMISFDTPFIPGFEAIGVLDRLVGIDSFMYVNNETVRKMIKEGKLAEVAEPTLNVEKAIAAKPDFIMTSATGTEFDNHPKLLAAKQKVVLNASYMEQYALGRTEWVKFSSLFFNKEAEAEAEFNKIEDTYNKVAEKMSASTKKPTTFSGLPYKDTWSIAGGQSFVAQWFTDAGTQYLWADDKSTGSLPLKVEQVLEKAGNADLWLVNGFGIADKAALLQQDPRYGNFAAVKSGNIWNNDLQTNENGGNLYFELGAHRPDLVLSDIAKIAHPELMTDHKFVFYRQLK